jgi:hypothetical protein
MQRDDFPCAALALARAVVARLSEANQLRKTSQEADRIARDFAPACHALALAHNLPADDVVRLVEDEAWRLEGEALALRRLRLPDNAARLHPQARAPRRGAA